MRADVQKRWILIGVISLTIGILDYVTGYVFSFFVFYFLPVSLAAWFIGKSGAIVFAIFCSIVWAVVYIHTRHFVIPDFLTIWNASIRLAAFLAIGLSVSTIKNSLQIEKETAQKLRESIIEREKTEAALRASNERFRLAAKAAHIGTYSRNLQSGEDDWSPEFLAIHGFAPHDTLPLSDGIPSVVHPEDRQKILNELEQPKNRTTIPLDGVGLLNFCYQRAIVVGRFTAKSVDKVDDVQPIIWSDQGLLRCPDRCARWYVIATTPICG